jgi:hypothetical protein
MIRGARRTPKKVIHVLCLAAAASWFFREF